MGNYKQFLCEYKYCGNSWSFTIWAESHEDAQARLRCIANSGQINGELKAVIPAKLGFIAKAFVWVCNTMTRLLSA